jgi:hypothetical protein
MSARVRDVPNSINTTPAGRPGRQVAGDRARTLAEPRLVPSSPTARARETASSRPLTPSLR